MPDWRTKPLELMCWPPAHCEALREFLTRGMSYSDTANAINARFGTAYSRNATLGRARRMHLSQQEPSMSSSQPGGVRLPELRLRRSADDFRLREFVRRPPVFAPVETAPLRCVEIEPRHLTLIELECGDCRFPYGGDADGEAITFCGHPSKEGSRYCVPHFHLSRNPDIPPAGRVGGGGASLRLVSVI